MDVSDKLMSHDLAALINAVCKKIGLHPIISSGSLDDGLINLNEFFRIASSVILIYVARLEFGWPLDIPEWSDQGAETTSPCWSNAFD
jgi:hypothetical protein